MHDDNFKHVFLYTSMLSFNCEKNINIIKIFDFSQNLRPNMGLIDPSPLETSFFYLLHHMRLCTAPYRFQIRCRFKGNALISYYINGMQGGQNCTGALA